MTERGRRAGAGELAGAIDALGRERAPLFAAGRHRAFFERMHELRGRFRTASLSAPERGRLWDRLNEIAEEAKAEQAREFAGGDAANLARWREQIAVAEGYAAALLREIAELEGRVGTPGERSRWGSRIAEKRARLAEVEANVTRLRAKVEDVTRRAASSGGERRGAAGLRAGQRPPRNPR